MTEPTTVNVGLIVPNTGDLVGTWGSGALNPDFVSVDGHLGGVQTIGIAGTPVTLTSPAGFVPTPGPGPTQAENAILRFTGTLTAFVTVTLPLPGYYIIENLASPGAGFTVAFRAAGSGQVVSTQAGSCRHIYSDGTNVRFVNLPDVGTYIDYAATTVPNWISSCTIPPYLNCDGTLFNGATYPFLAAFLGGTRLPDYRGNVGFYLNQGTGRLTSAGAGIDGNTLFASGGNNGLFLGAGQVPTLASSGNNNIIVFPNGSSSSSVPVNAGGGGWVANSVPLGGTGALFPQLGSPASFAIATNFSNSQNISVSYINGGQTIVPSTVPGVVGGIRLIRAA